MRISRLSVVAALALGLMTQFACERREDGGPRASRDGKVRDGTTSDTSWLVQAAEANLTEIEVGGLADSKAASTEVKQFGRQMVDDHSKANQELADLAKKKGVAVPTQLDEKQRKATADVSQLNGAEFDRKFSDMMVSDHEKAVSLFESHADSKDADVKAFVDRTLPTLKHHLEMARDLKSKVSGAPKAD